MCFASFPGYVGKIFLSTADKDQAAAIVRAYNDWHVDEWCGTYPGRFIPLIVPMMWDPEAHGGGGAPRTPRRAATR